MPRVLVALASMGLVALLMGGSSALVLRWAVECQDAVISNHTHDLQLVEDFIVAEERAARHARSYLLTGHPRFLAERAQARQVAARQLVLLKRHVESPDGRALLGRAEVLLERLRVEQDELLRRRSVDIGAEEAGRLMTLRVQPARDEMDAVLENLRLHKERLLEDAKRSAERAVSRAFTLQSLTVAAGLLLSVSLALMLVRTYRRLLEASEFQQRVVAIVGHDVRSPLAAIMASTSHALSRPGLTPQLDATLSRVLRSARRIEVLTKLLMDFSRVRTPSGLTLAHEPGDLSALCEQVLRDARRLHPSRQLIHRSEGDCRADFDRDRLEQALANLVDNALRHGSAEGPVTLVSRGTNPSVVEVCIHNLGVPIHPRLLPHIFEPFRHGHRAEEVVRESLGMGLYIVSEVVRAHGGRVDVASSAEQGTAFTVRLPRIRVGPEGFPGSSRRG